MSGPSKRIADAEASMAELEAELRRPAVQKSEHTPTPWRKHPIDDATIVDAKGVHVCTTTAVGPRAYAYIDFSTDIEACADRATFICLAGNAHEALVDALKEARDVVKDDIESIEETGAESAHERAVLARIDAALALAGADK